MNELTLDNQVDLDLDVQIAGTGSVSSVLMADTDDGCDTEKTGDC
jgi:hypothetical protein